MSSADFTIYTPGIRTLSYTVSSPRGEFSAFSAANAIHNFPVFIPPGTHHCWVDRGSMVWEVFAQHLYTWINFSDLMGTG